jgi:hypothetical protein
MLDCGGPDAVKTATPPLRHVAAAADGFAGGCDGETSGDAEEFDDDDAGVGGAGAEDTGVDDTGAEDTGAEGVPDATVRGAFGSAAFVDPAP